ncbi:unnamed protein product [Rodentolepis nana]|uniref:WAPL domain-containing protein n=1 Tax=Rodentolepis nana TaxID=102285 RepID=A0A0R3T8V5_RODNA|nr:unnamed protein product [Rodentolepis nana]
MVACSSTITPRSSFKGSQDFPQKQRAPVKLRYIFASCKSPLPVDIGKGVNSQATTPLPPPPPPLQKAKSFFTDPDVSFEESAEGLGLHIPSPKKPMSRPKPRLKHQTARTPLGVYIRTEECNSARRLSSRAPSSRSVNSPYSVVSGLETPTRTGSCKTLEVPITDAIDLNSSDDDIASVSHNKLSSEERLAKEIEEDETPPPKRNIPLSQLSQQKSKRGSKEQVFISAISQKHAGASQSEKETPLSHASTSRVVGRCRSKTAPTVKTTPIIIERGGKFNVPKNKTPQSTSMTEKAREHNWRKSPAITSNSNPLNEVFTRKGDVYDLEESSELEEPAPKQPNLETFEKFVEENKLEMLPKNQRRRLHMGDSNNEAGLVKEITKVLGKEASLPLTRNRIRGRNAAPSNEKARASKNNGNDKRIAEVSFSLQNDSQDALLKPSTTKEFEHIAKNDERPIGLTRSGKRFSQSPVNEGEGTSSKKAKGKPPTLSGRDKRRSRSTSKKKEVDEANENEILAGSTDIIQSLRLSQEKTPTPARAQIGFNASQEDLLADLSPIHTPKDAQAISQSQEQNRVLNQCPSAKNTAFILESVRSLHPGPEKIDASKLISEVFPKQTPKRAAIAPLAQLQERLYFLRATPERARSSNASPDVQRLPFSVPKIPTPIIEAEKESSSKSMEVLPRKFKG